MPFDRDSLRKALIAAYRQIHSAQTGTEISEVQTEFEDKLLVLKGKISPTSEESKYLTSQAGKKLVRQVRLGLLEEARPFINAQISSLTGLVVHESFVDIDLERGILQHTFNFKQVYEDVI